MKPKPKPALTPEQAFNARKALGWSLRQTAAKIGLRTHVCVESLEKDRQKNVLGPAKIAKLRACYEKAGVKFLPDSDDVEFTEEIVDPNYHGYGTGKVYQHPITGEMTTRRPDMKGTSPGIKRLYTPELGDLICDMILAGWRMKDFRLVDKRHDWEIEHGLPPGTIPAEADIYKWMYDPQRAPGFGEMYKRVRELWIQRLVGETIDIADEDREDMVAVQAAKNRITARQWIASRVLRDDYGDRVDANVKHTHQYVGKSNEELHAELAYLRGQTPELAAITVEATTVQENEEKKGAEAPENSK